MTSMAYTMKDPIALAKALTAYAKANPSFTFKAGLVEGRVIEVKFIQELASMPSREDTAGESFVFDFSLGAAPGHCLGRRGTQSRDSG